MTRQYEELWTSGRCDFYFTIQYTLRKYSPGCPNSLGCSVVQKCSSVAAIPPCPSFTDDQKEAPCILSPPCTSPLPLHLLPLSPALSSVGKCGRNLHTESNAIRNNWALLENTLIQLTVSFRMCKIKLCSCLFPVKRVRSRNILVPQSCTLLSEDISKLRC